MTPVASTLSRTPDAAPSGGPAQRVTVAAIYAVDGDLRFLSHHNEMRLLARAVIRARWQVSYTEGFNPLPRVRIPLPRSVGMASSCQLALIDLLSPAPARDLFAQLAATLPAESTLLEVSGPIPGRRAPQPLSISYELALPAEGDDDSSAVDLAALAERIDAVRQAESLLVQRTFGPDKPASTVDVRPYLAALTLQDRVVRMVLSYEQQRTARPTEIIQSLGLAEQDFAHRVRRVRVDWDKELRGHDVWPPTSERNHFGQEEDHHQDRQDAQA